MELKIKPEVSPRNGKVIVHISYRTATNRSVRASSSLLRTCSGDISATVPSALPGFVRGARALSGFRVLFASPKLRICVTSIRDEDVGGLDVTMNDVLRGCGIECVGY
jgi:hypothetical protein